MAVNNPFKPAIKQAKRIKMLFYGSAGTGKTTTALKLGALAGGKIALIDMEGGADLYAEMATFDVLRTKSYQDVMNALDFIEKQKHEYSLLILDPITVLWNVIIEAFQIVRVDKGLTHADWGIIKRKMYAIYNRLVNLPLHVIVIARAKDEYQGTDDNKRKVGENPDAEKSIEYLFDVVLNIRVNGENRFADVSKDRSNSLGKRVTDLSPDSFKALFGTMPNTGEYHQESEADAAAKIVQELEAEAKTEPPAKAKEAAASEAPQGESPANGNGHAPASVDSETLVTDVLAELKQNAARSRRGTRKLNANDEADKGMIANMGRKLGIMFKNHKMAFTKAAFNVEHVEEMTMSQWHATNDMIVSSLPKFEAFAAAFIATRPVYGATEQAAQAGEA